MRLPFDRPADTDDLMSGYELACLLAASMFVGFVVGLIVGIAG